MQAGGIQGYGGGGPPLPPAGEIPQQQQSKLPTSLVTSVATGGWSEHETPDGFKYYYHLVTGISSWDSPVEVQTARVAQPHAPTGMWSMPNVSQFASSMRTISMAGGQQISSTATPNHQVSQQPLFLATSAAPSSSTSMNEYPTNRDSSSSGPNGSIQDRYSAVSSASLLGGGFENWQCNQAVAPRFRALVACRTARDLTVCWVLRDFLVRAPSLWWGGAFPARRVGTDTPSPRA